MKTYLLALILFLAACSGPKSETAPPPRSVRVAPVRLAPLDATLSVAGTLTPKDESRLSFKIGGVIASVAVEEGQAVRQGQVLATLQPTESDAAVEQAREAAVKAARDLERGRALLADGVATQEQVQDLTTAFKVARAQERSVAFNAEYARIVAAEPGVVLRKLAEAHELVQAGQPVVVLGGARRGWVVRSGLADKDVVRVKLGDAAQVRLDAWPERAFPGRVSNIASAADPATGTFAVEVQVEPAGAAFGEGMVGKVTLQPADARLGPLVPAQALLEANDEEAGVFVYDPQSHQVQRVTVQLGRLHRTEVEVLGGLAPTAQVVIDGAAYLENGEVVRVAAP